jgi:hypothetical protein
MQREFFPSDNVNIVEYRNFRCPPWSEVHITWSETEKTRLCLYLFLLNKLRKSTRISFKMVPFSVDTQLHTMLPTFKAILQITF